MTVLAEFPTELLGLVSIVGGFIVVVVSIVYASQLRMNKQREETRREIAAYVAEGSISADDARKILEASGSMIDAFASAVKNKIR